MALVRFWRGEQTGKRSCSFPEILWKIVTQHGLLYRPTAKVSAAGRPGVFGRPGVRYNAFVDGTSAFTRSQPRKPLAA